MAMKKTLLEIVQDILSDMDSEPVNQLSDTLEAEQVATIVEHTFYDMIALRIIPEHKELIKLTPMSDNAFPTHFEYPANVNRVEKVWYDKSTDADTDATREYSEVKWMEPIDFLEMLDKRQEDFVVVQDKRAGTELYIYNDRMPSYYTSFDDYYIVMDAFDALVDDTLQESKVRAYGTVYPVFDRWNGGAYPDIDAEYFPYLINEAKSRCFDMLKGGTTQKIEQAARRAKIHVQNDKWRTKRANKWNDFGR